MIGFNTGDPWLSWVTCKRHGDIPYPTPAAAEWGARDHEHCQGYHPPKSRKRVCCG